MASDASIEPGQCDLALDYLLNEDKEACFGYYYDSDKDLITNRPPGMLFHCVYVEGRADSATLVGYIEYYSLWRIVLVLSESYTGSDFTHIYAVDPLEGKELNISVSFDLSVSDIRDANQHNKYEISTLLGI